jgi:hypothetical protein
VLTAALLDSVHRACGERGIDPLTDARVDEVLKRATEHAKANAGSRFGDARQALGEFAPKAHKALKLLAEGLDATPGIKDVPPQRRWMLFVDYEVVDALKRMGLDVKNPLLGFMFDRQKSFLENAARGYKLMMRDARVAATPPKPLTAEAIKRVHTIAAAGTRSQGAFNVKHGGFAMHAEAAGAAKCLDTMRGLHANHGDKVTMELLAATGGAHLTCWHYPTTPGTSAEPDAEVDQWFAQFYDRIGQIAPDDPSRSDQAVLALIDLSRQLHLRHPFVDGNGRMNYRLQFDRLLTDLGEPLAVLDNMANFVGLSDENALASVRRGQQRFRQMSDPAFDFEALSGDVGGPDLAASGAAFGQSHQQVVSLPGYRLWAMDLKRSDVPYDLDNSLNAVFVHDTELAKLEPQDKDAALATLQAALAQATPPSVTDSAGAKVVRHTDDTTGMALQYTVRKTGEAVDLRLSRPAS